MAKNKLRSFLLLLTLTQTVFAQGLSKNCFNEIMAVTEKNANFDLQSFSKDLVVEVAKVKVQMKLPFGKPSDSKVADIGITVGCLKTFPENPSQILTFLKDVGTELAKREIRKRGANTPAQGINASSSQPQALASFASSRPVPVLKECDAVFNPEKKFCYDGDVYNRCDGMPYNPTTHICDGDVANRALCGGAQYNPLIQRCENDAIIMVCGETEYNSGTHGCKDGITLPKCGTVELYNPTTHGCRNDIVFPKCGEILYNPKTHGCKNNVVFVLPKCGTGFYNPATHGCSNNIVFPKCHETLYNPKTHGCKDNVVFEIPKCGTEFYDPATHGCIYNTVIILPKCGTISYNPATHDCKENTTLLARCGTTLYDSATHGCENDIVFKK